MKRILSILGIFVLAWTFQYGQEMSTPRNVSRSFKNSIWAQVAMGPQGEVHIVWVEEDLGATSTDVLYVKYDGVKWSTPFKIANVLGGYAERPYIYCNPKGVIVVFWNQDGYMTVREYSPSQKKWLEAEKVSEDYSKGILESWVTLDSDGNIYGIWFSKIEGRVWTRSRINGSWESIIRMSTSGIHCTHVAIAAGTDGRVWAIWRQRLPEGGYDIYYSKRTKSTPWTTKKTMNPAGQSQSHPGMAVGPDNIPYVVYNDQPGEGDNAITYLCKLDEVTNPLSTVMGSDLVHYPRIAFDAYRNKHVAIQKGPGDNGTGIKYTNNIGGAWKEPIVMPNSAGFTKLPGISADAFGNVVLVWAAAGEVWFSSLSPVVFQKFVPPINLAAHLEFTPDPTYKLSWEANPMNNILRVKGYNIYKKEEADSEWQPLLSVSKTTTSASFTFAEIKPTIQFAIATVANTGFESEMALFDITYPTLYAAADMKAAVAISYLKGVPDVTYKLSWQTNPQNVARFIQGYRIYKKEGTGTYVLLTALMSTTFSASYTFANPTQRIFFVLSTVSVLGTESPVTPFWTQ